MNNEQASNQNTLALLRQLKDQMPEIWNQAEVVGQWVWLEFNVVPGREVRERLREFGFHWNRDRKCWQHPCGASTDKLKGNPKSRYSVVPAREVPLNDEAVPYVVPPAHEFKIVAMRECPLPEDMALCDTPEKAVEYWKLHIVTNPHFNPECECFVVLMLNTRRRVRGHQLLSIGTMDTILVHPREVFRAAVIAGASAVLALHNHPSGEPEPSEADIKVTRDLIRAGQLIRIELLDHVVIGANRHSSLRSLGYFYS